MLVSKLLTVNSVMIYDSAPLESYIPYFSDVKVIQGDTLGSDTMGIYYGDEVNLLFWEQLDLDFGSDVTYSTLYHLVNGYTYTYYVETKKFIITDSSSNVVFSASNVNSIADFCIDFEVYSSHQLMIIISPYSNIFKFYKLAKLMPSNSGGILTTTPNVGIQDIVIPDRVRPYGKDDEDNPTWCIKYLGYADRYSTLTLNSLPIGLINKAIPLQGFKFGEFNYNKLLPNNNFYENVSEFEKVVSLLSKQYVSNLLMYALLLPDLSKNMYPALQVIKNPYETSNTRPLYYPWLIWGIYEILTNYKTSDDIDPSLEIFPFDLSPDWE